MGRVTPVAQILGFEPGGGRGAGRVRPRDACVSLSELAGSEDLVLGAHPARSIGERVGAVGQQEARGSEQVGVGEQTIQGIALLFEQCCGVVAVACEDQVSVVEDVARASERVAVVDQGQLASIPAPVARMTILLGDQRIKELLLLY